MVSCAETYLVQMIFSFVLGGTLVGMVAAVAWPQEIEGDEHEDASVG